MSLDTYGFIADCGCCVEYALNKMQHDPLSPTGIEEARESFGDLWAEYEDTYMYMAKSKKGKGGGKKKC
jgi:hypothetical protein